MPKLIVSEETLPNRCLRLTKDEEYETNEKHSHVKDVLVNGQRSVYPKVSRRRTQTSVA